MKQQARKCTLCNYTYISDQWDKMSIANGKPVEIRHSGCGGYMVAAVAELAKKRR